MWAEIPRRFGPHPWRIFHAFGRYLSAPFERIEPLMPREGEILDYGCGSGLFAFYLSERSPARRIRAFDIDSGKIELARASNPRPDRIEFHESPAAIPPGPYDAICCIDVIYLLQPAERRQAIDLFSRLLKPSGRLFLKVMDPSKTAKMKLEELQENLAVKVFKITESTSGRLDMIRDLPGLEKDLRDAGFAIERIPLDRFYPHPHLLLIANKAR